MRFDFHDIDRARKILCLGERASIREIKESYFNLAKKFHPDKGAKSCDEIRELNWAYKLLMDYVLNFKFSFKREDILRNDPEFFLKRFYNGWF